MKKIFFLLVFILSSLINYSQCVPGPYLKAGIYPDTLENLDTANINQYYEVVMTAVIPKDTFVFGNILPIDSIGIDTLFGLPSSLTYKADRPSSYWLGGTKGCIQIFGTPSNSEVGVYPLNITVNAVVAGLPALYPVKGYKIVVRGNNNILEETSLKKSLKIFPNPAKTQTSLQMFSNYNETVKVYIINSLGKKVKEITTNVVYGQNTLNINLSDLAKGIYYVSTETKFEIEKQILVVY